MDSELKRKLTSAAINARANAYAPYSGFKVGAAVVADNGNVYTGCNIENASYGATLCAERAAVCGAISSGAKKITAIAVCASDIPVLPCGICRQVLTEFASSPDMPVLCLSSDGTKAAEYTINDLLPMAFSSFSAD